MSGSDSDATWPATNDFQSRFLEIDEYEQNKDSQLILPRFRPNRGPKDTDPCSSSIGPTESRDGRRLRCRRRVVQDDDSESDDERLSSGPTRSSRRKSTGNPSSAHPDRVVDEDVDSEEDRELLPFRNPKLLTARQLSLKMQRSASGVNQTSGTSSRSRGLFDAELLTLESLEPPKPVNKPTPEQLLARQQRIARRRESAKRKVEMEKQQTVERLLKINANSVGLPKRGRGRGRGLAGRLGFHATPSSADPTISDENDDDDGDDEDDDRDEPNDEDEGDQSNGNSQKDTIEAKRIESAEISARLLLAEQHGLSAATMDPQPGYVRWLSSSRLTPSNRICVGPGMTVYPFVEVSCARQLTTGGQLCALGCGRLKRYNCSVTGQPVCSLACYKQSMLTLTNNQSAKQPCA